MEVFWFEQTMADVPADDDWLSEAERAKVRALRIPKRRADWRFGRWTAKQAIALASDAKLSPLCTIELRAAPSGAPLVFIRGVAAQMTISLSHCGGAAVCAFTNGAAALGCDVESVVPRADPFVADYFTEAEQQLVAATSMGDRELVINLIWSAKESALKALRTGLRLDTRSVQVSLDAVQTDGTTPRGLSCKMPPWLPLSVTYGNRRFHGRWFCGDHSVRTLVYAAL